MERASVLLVDDSTVFSGAFAHALARRARRESLHVDVVLTRSVAGALESSAPFDAALIDWTLPDGTALDVLRAWRASRRRQGLPARVISADSVDAISGHCLMLDAPAVNKLPPELLLDVTMKLVTEVARAPRSPVEEAARFAEALAVEAGLSPALRDLLARRLAGASLREIAVARGTTLGTVKIQNKALVAALRNIGIDARGNLTSLMLRELLEERYEHR